MVSLGITHPFDRNVVPETVQNVYQLDSAGIPVPCSGSERKGGCRVQPYLVHWPWSIQRRPCGVGATREGVDIIELATWVGSEVFSLVVTCVQTLCCCYPSNKSFTARKTAINAVHDSFSSFLYDATILSTRFFFMTPHYLQPAF